LDRRVGLISGGERQALALAMILIKKPQILLLDEPSAGLSPRYVKDIMEKIKEINAAWKTTVLLVEQNVGEALKIAEKTIVMSGGKIESSFDNSVDILKERVLESVFFGSNIE